FVPISQPNFTTYGETFGQPPDNPTSRLSTAASNHGPKATAAEPENRTSKLKRKKPGINRKSKPQKLL
ncbi:hypothetical protein AZE42_08754, partial [Rhizopogon vesiculosus]